MYVNYEVLYKLRHAVDDPVCVEQHPNLFDHAVFVRGVIERLTYPLLSPDLLCTQVVMQTVFKH